MQEKADLGTVQFNVYHKTGFELDIFHRESRLNIELDGPHHSNCLARDDSRDEILERHKIKVVRIPLVGKQLESVAADVLRLLEDAQGNPVASGGVLGDRSSKATVFQPARPVERGVRAGEWQSGIDFTVLKPE